MKAYEHLDAWKVCHELTLGVYETTKPMLDSDPDIAHQLRLAALLAAAKLARGAGTGNMTMFRECAGMSAGHLSEVSYYLNIAHVMGLVSDATQQKLDALRGRALFYIWKHLCPAPPAAEADAPTADDQD
jgi:four helix bundle protein